ncbi:peptidoglycan-binding domain-containing protein [Actinoplanes sp. NPDC051861]|uniref:peptidoglycan-binding domain-containing protein n=1 Tax=Actinoplanes sp. NPDC051861 TaxID=3155170 RepID=UPI00344751EC
MRRRTVLGAATVAVVGAGAGRLLWDEPAVPSVTSVPTGSATVVRTDLSTTTTLPGTLGYTGSYAVYWPGPAAGTVTWLPLPGQVIGRGQPLLAVDNRPVRLLYGDRPAWRSLERGVAAGRDVRALERNLVALGHATTAGLTVDGTFTGATAAAVRRWQRATRQPATGRIELGAVAFLPGRMRVTTLGAAAGGPVTGTTGGPVLSGTSPEIGVTLAVPVTKTHLVHLRDAVTVTLPAGESVPGRVTALSTVASTPSAESGRGDELASVAATVSLDRQASAAALDQAPVEVNVIAESAEGVLAVPITALVALAGGGFGVYLLEDGARRLVGVTPGLFARTMVQVEAADLREGATVEAPA